MAVALGNCCAIGPFNLSPQIYIRFIVSMSTLACFKKNQNHTGEDKYCYYHLKIYTAYCVYSKIL